MFFYVSVGRAKSIGNYRFDASCCTPVTSIGVQLGYADISLIMGDWHFVVDSTDRFTKEAGTWSGQEDEAEVAWFMSNVMQPSLLSFSIFEVSYGTLTALF